MKYDFGGYATRNDLKCGDGRRIRKNAFIDNDGKRVSLVWMHQHKDPENVIGHADLENREDGVYAYCSLNNTPKAQTAKELVAHGDVCALSIFAGNLKEKAKNVFHGDIKEVSLVIAGANPGALIDEIAFAHSDEDMCADEAVIWIDSSTQFLSHGEIERDEKYSNLVTDDTDENMEDNMAHSDDERTVQDVLDEMTDEQRDVVDYLVNEALSHSDTVYEGEMVHADDDTDDDTDDERTIQDVLDEMTDEQKDVLTYLIGAAVEEEKNKKGDTEMKHNAFDVDLREEVIAHSEFLDAVVADGKRFGSLKESYIAHADGNEDEAEAAGAYGISNIEMLYPEATNLNTEPEMITRPMEWVSKVLGGVHTTPFSRIRSTFADLREDEARAKGYIKGKRKKEEVFSLLKRVTIPTTIYKKQKLDRDDVSDITSFDVIRWIRKEMDVMLDEEKARAILVGDGRSKSDDDHISEDNIRPIWKDDDLYSVKVTIPIEKNATDAVKADKFIEANIKSRKEYKGSGNPTMFITEDRLTSMLLLKDANGRYIYESENALKNVLRVKEIVSVPVMEGLRRNPAGTNKLHSLEAIVVNLADYNVGNDPMGKKNFFDDFDIDFNQYKYLLETRYSGALIKPFSALVFEFDDGTTTA